MNIRPSGFADKPTVAETSDIATRREAREFTVTATILEKLRAETFEALIQHRAAAHALTEARNRRDAIAPIPAAAPAPAPKEIASIDDWA